ncbi:hypothetical protein CERZMDRAFT_86515 [Cercospora zeae-maydis SCOH1-5]|uniref:Uncharacterized protein n=1 Tax=Cercospora zeae-maydis SCOH1-5 TaxID=717836 RepID=A0A6A6F8Z7_9PEZI|nr:hypothetical protein CERZMDRAFT_86515 [Cercospora zeae-maydis SCOH1-5]
MTTHVLNRTPMPAPTLELQDNKHKQSIRLPVVRQAPSVHATIANMHSRNTGICAQDGAQHSLGNFARYRPDMGCEEEGSWIVIAPEDQNQIRNSDEPDDESQLVSNRSIAHEALSPMYTVPLYVFPAFAQPVANEPPPALVTRFP